VFNFIRIGVLIFYFLVFPVVAAQETLNLEQVLAHHLEAMGGKENISSLRNLELKLRIWEPEFEVEGFYRASVEGMMRIDIFAGEQRVFSEGIDAAGGWQQNGEGAAVLGISEQGLLALQQGIRRNLRGLMHVPSSNDLSRSLEQQYLDGTNYFVASLNEPDGIVRTLYINIENWLVERTRQVKALHPDIDSTEIRTEERHSLFKPLCGVMRSHREESFDLETKALLQTTEIIEGRCNLDSTELNLGRPLE